VVVLAMVLKRLVHRAIRRFTARLVVSAGSSGRLKSILEGQPDPRAAGRAATLGDVLRSLATAGIYGIALLTILGEVGINLGPLVASAGIVGVALGFGAQSLVKDFLSGVFMLVEDQYGVGDVVDLGPASGTVEAVGLRTTRIRDVQGVVWHVPNGQVNRVGNKSQDWSRAVLDIEVGYGTDLRVAQEAIEQAAAEVCGREPWTTAVLAPPEVWGVEALGKEAVALRLVVKTRPAAQFALLRELRLRTYEALDREGIKAPLARQVVPPPVEEAQPQPQVKAPETAT
ncbi:MAG TPA: mechanosensitive ion channel family protein, partial [Acidimicrobiales bacterium]|nr:mechanosensitive ion channel family protein [Acidimicrobiales bacterium]